MSDYYHHFLSSMAGVGGPPTMNAQDVPPPIQRPPGMAIGGGSPLPNPYQSLGYFAGFPDPVMFNAPKSQRNRRKSASGPDHIKHRRTRSGCYTCRSRRVKCDETHPICERCRKGKRECVYPEPPQPKGSAGQSSKDAKDSMGASQQTSPSSSRGEDEDDGDQDIKLEPILDEDEDEPDSATTQSAPARLPPRRSSTMSSFGLQRIVTNRQGSETPSFDDSQSISPSATTGSMLSDFPFPIPGAQPDWSYLPHELQFYLKYFCENITHYHYCMVDDSEDFFRTVLVNIALCNEPLLYAVVGFAAYHHTLKSANGRIMEFLQYYNRSVTLLLAFLKKKEKHNVATLLTILQLATIEEYLGDWVNLMGHQRAALEILTQLFTPHSAVQTQIGRIVLTWYARFDVFIGIMGSFQTSLSREWFSAAVEFYESKADAEPDHLGWKLKGADAKLRHISFEMSVLFGKGAREEITKDEYLAEHGRIAQLLEGWKENWDPALTNPACLAEVPRDLPSNPDDIVPSFVPGILYKPPLFSTTILMAEWHSITLMHASQSLGTSSGLATDTQEHAYAICQISETVERWQFSPAGSLIILHAGLAIAALFVPRDPRHHMWIRRKFALLESMGYICPVTLRRRMSELFNDESCVRWWLPDDEGFSPILKSIRTFADERNATAVTAQSESLRDVRHVFAKMELQGGGEAQRREDDGVQGKGKNVQA